MLLANCVYVIIYVVYWAYISKINSTILYYTKLYYYYYIYLFIYYKFSSKFC